MAATSFRTLLDAAMAQARSAPADPSARMKLFRLFCVSGQWDRAATQADTGSNLDAELGFTTLVYKQALACEKFRADVFAGTRVPVAALFENLEDGSQVQEFVDWFPGVTLDQARSVLEHAARSALAEA